MNDIVRCTNRAGKTIGRCRDGGIERSDQRQVCAPGRLGQVRPNRFGCEGARNLTGVASPHAVTDDIESEWRVGHKTIFVVRPFKAGIGFGAMQLFECQRMPPSGCETLQAGTEITCEFFRAPIAVKQLFL